MNTKQKMYKNQGLLLNLSIMLGSMMFAWGISMLMNAPTGYQYDLITQGLAVCSFALLFGILAYAIKLEDKCYKMVYQNVNMGE